MNGEGVPRCRHFGCWQPATHLVHGMPGYPWSGHYCEPHALAQEGLYDHQGGCVIVALSGRTEQP